MSEAFTVRSHGRARKPYHMIRPCQLRFRRARHSPDHPRGRPRKAYHMIPGCQTRSSSSGIPTRITAGRAPGEHHPPWTCHSRHESADSVFFTPPPGHPVGVLSTRWNSTHEPHRTQNQG
ncbi:hypothetical protein MICRO11B_20001 [Micrococcus luteus]|nr:hypothetical protein MICRO11B_20001 [Micrococcus luteus]